MAHTHPDVIVKKLDIAWAFFNKQLSLYAVNTSAAAIPQLEIFKTVYKAISEAVEENDGGNDG